MTAKLYREASSFVDNGAYLDGVDTAVKILNEKPRHKKAVALITENYERALENGEALLHRASFSEEPKRSEQTVQIYEKLVNVAAGAAQLKLAGAVFPDYSSRLAQARSEAVRLFLSYAERATDYREAHNFGVKAQNYASVADKESVREQMAAILYKKAAVLAAVNGEQSLLKALDCYAAVEKWVFPYADTGQRVLEIKMKLAQLYYEQAIEKSQSGSRSELKQAMTLFEKTVALVSDYKDSRQRMAKLNDRLTVRVFCYSPDWSRGASYWRSSSFGYFNGTAVAAEFQTRLARNLIGNRYIAFPNYSVNAVLWNGGLSGVQRTVREGGCDYMVVVNLSLPSGGEVTKSTADRSRSYRTATYRVLVKTEQNGVVSIVSSATVSEATYNRLSANIGNQSAFESTLRQAGVRLNKPSSGKWYYDTDTGSASVQLTEREYIFEFPLRATAEVVDLWSGRTVYTKREAVTVRGSGGKEYVNLPPSHAHLKTPDFKPDYSMEKALTDAEIEKILSRLATDVALFLGRQT